jgi:triphosphatase
MGQEIEFKLAIVSERADDLWRVLESRHSGLKPASRLLFSAYYDTPDGRLRKDGAALRLRREGNRWIQAVKRAGQASGGLHRRSEHETEVAAQLPSFPAMAEAGLGDLVAVPDVRDNLQVVFSTEFTRTSALVRTGHTRIEVALDQGFIAADGRQETFCEIELELKAGAPDDLFALAMAIASALPVRLENRSKAQRGYALAAGSKPAPVKAAASPLRPEMSVPEALAAVALDALAHLQANERGLLDGRNAEYLHQARVALRRLRSALRAFAPGVPQEPFTPLREELRLLAGTLGEARDADVFVAEVLARVGGGPHAGLTALRNSALAARRNANRAARMAVRAPAYTQLILRLTQALARIQTTATGETATLDAFAREALQRAHRKVRKRGRKLRALDFEALHRLRIACKRLRYATEFFAPLAPGESGDTLEALSAVQDILGRINDDATAWQLLDALAVEQASPDFQQAAGYVRGWTARDAGACLTALPDAWKRLKKLDNWWE